MITALLCLQPDPFEKRITFTDARGDPNTCGKPIDYSFRKVEQLSQLENGIPREYRIGVPKKSGEDKFITR